MSARVGFAGLGLSICMLWAPGCAQAPADGQGPGQEEFRLRSLAKTDIDDVLEIHVREARADLRLLMQKLYRRNPRELKKSPVPSIEDNVRRLFDEPHDWHFEELAGARGAEAIRLALSDECQGDRVFAFMTGLSSMIMAAYGYKTEFFVFDSVDPQKLYNSARNIEIAAWKLQNNYDSRGNPFLLSNSLPGEPRNLSFERLFGELIATQDNIVIAGKTKRVIKKVIQQMATAVFLPI